MPTRGPFRMSSRRSFTAHRDGNCERCRGAIAAGERIQVCAGVYGAYEHAVAADCRAAFRALQREQLARYVGEGVITADAAARILARDDAAAKYPDEPGQ